jgi:hypothetical protein
MERESPSRLQQGFARLPQELQREIVLQSARARASAAASALTRYAPGVQTAPRNMDVTSPRIKWPSRHESPLVWSIQWPGYPEGINHDHLEVPDITLMHPSGGAVVVVAFCESSERGTGSLDIRPVKTLRAYGSDPREVQKLQRTVQSWYADPRRLKNILRELISGLRQQQHNLPPQLKVPRLIVIIMDDDLEAIQTGRRGASRSTRTRTRIPVEEFTRLLFLDFVNGGEKKA